MAIKLMPGRKYPLTREVFRASLDDLLERETRKAKATGDVEHLDDLAYLRREWSNPRRFESYYRVWRAMLDTPLDDEE